MWSRDHSQRVSVQGNLGAQKELKSLLSSNQTDVRHPTVFSASKARPEGLEPPTDRVLAGVPGRTGACLFRGQTSGVGTCLFRGFPGRTVVRTVVKLRPIETPRRRFATITQVVPRCLRPSVGCRPHRRGFRLPGGQHQFRHPRTAVDRRRLARGPGWHHSMTRTSSSTAVLARPSRGRQDPCHAGRRLDPVVDDSGVAAGLLGRVHGLVRAG